MEVCAVCGRPSECKHHLIFGVSLRTLADQDNITIPMCNRCHNMANWQVDKIHGNSMAEKLSKMLGQMMWERNYIASKKQVEEAREQFMKRYGRSFL